MANSLTGPILTICFRTKKRHKRFAGTAHRQCSTCGRACTVSRGDLLRAGDVVGQQRDGDAVVCCGTCTAAAARRWPAPAAPPAGGPATHDLALEAAPAHTPESCCAVVALYHPFIRLAVINRAWPRSVLRAGPLIIAAQKG